jgi:FOG: Ankyrin repeat
MGSDMKSLKNIRKSVGKAVRNSIVGYQDSKLLTAIRNFDDEVIRAEIARLSVREINAFGKDEDSAIVVAASLGNVECVRLLLAKGVDPNLANGYGETALHAAASAGQEAVIDKLLPLRRFDLQVDKQEGCRYETPLMKAAAAGHVSIVEKLVACWSEIRSNKF